RLHPRSGAAARPAARAPAVHDLVPQPERVPADVGRFAPHDHCDGCRVPRKELSGGRAEETAAGGEMNATLKGSLHREGLRFPEQSKTRCGPSRIRYHKDVRFRDSDCCMRRFVAVFIAVLLIVRVPVHAEDLLYTYFS